MASAGSSGGRCAACNGDAGFPFTSECAHTFHPNCVAGAAVCSVCGATWREAAEPTKSSPFGFSPVKPQPDGTCLFGQAPPASSPFSFGVSPTQPEPAPATSSSSPFSFGVSPAQPQPARTSLFQQHPATARPFFFQPEPTRTSLFGPTPAFGTVRTDTETRVFNDDEPVEEPPARAEPPLADGRSDVQEAASNGALVLRTHCEHPAVARGTARDNFAVLVHAKAPGAAAVATEAAAPRAPLDLVTVLDVSGSMTGPKLALLKEAMGFVIDKLGPADRLSIVSFSHDARRVIRLTRMSDSGKASAKLAVQSLAADGLTDILKGIGKAAKVLDGRRYRNAVASVILLSDGQDTCNNRQQGSYGAKSYHDLVARSLVSSDGSRSTPIHTFGFGTDHDAAAMHTIAEATGGTFSFIENQAVVQDSFAQCIGGLLSVAVQEAWIAVTCPHPGVRVRAVKSGRYESRVVAYGRAASVDVGELYADEERRFLLFVDVPRAGDGDDATRLVRVSCTYRDTATGQSMDVAGEDAVVQRPVEVTGQEPSMEVALERFRVEAAEDIAAAGAAAERGDHAEAARILDSRQEALQRSAPGLAGDARCAALVSELSELSARVANRREYEHTGRACLLVGMSSHAQQRASSVHLFGTMGTPAFGCPAPGSAAPGPFSTGGSAAFGAAFGSAPFAAAGAYATPAMNAMVDLSRKTRERHQQQPPTTTTTPKSGSIFAPNNGSS